MSNDVTEERFLIKKHRLYERLDDGSRQLLGPELKVIAFGRIDGPGDAFAVIKLRDYDGTVQFKYTLRQDLTTRAAVLSKLTAWGYLLPADQKKRTSIFECVSTTVPKGRRVIAPAPGWMEGRFVLPRRVIGQRKTDKLKIIYRRPEGVLEAKLGKKGTLADWKSGVAEPAGSSTTMTFAACFALAAPLVGLCGLEGGGVHAVAPTTSGKTLMLLVAKSVSGEATRDDLVPWRTTVNALEVVAFAYNGTLLCLDDTDQLPGGKKDHAELMRQVAHQLANGRGKLRLTMFGSGKGAPLPELKWKILVISNGVKRLADIVKADGAARMASEEVRLADMPCDVHLEYGVFETLPDGCSTHNEAVSKIETACKENYGTALRAFLKFVVRKREHVKREVASLMDDFATIALVSKTDNFEQRFAKKFALAFAAGILGARADILPWDETHIREAVLSCYRRARGAIPDAKTLLQDGLQRLEYCLVKKTVDVRGLTPAKRKKVKPKSWQGVLRQTEERGLHVAVLPQTFHSWFISGRMSQLVLQKLDETGRLLHEDRGEKPVPTCQVKFPWAARLRYYLITMQKRDGSDDEDASDE